MKNVVFIRGYHIHQLQFKVRHIRCNAVFPDWGLFQQLGMQGGSNFSEQLKLIVQFFKEEMRKSMKRSSEILIVDNDPNELKAILIGLQLEGFSVKGVSSSKEAIALLEKERFDVALVDLMMPHTNGLQLARKVRALQEETVTILMSAYHLSPIQLARANTGAIGFVPKPFKFEDLVEFIKSKMESRPVRSGKAPSSLSLREGGLFSPFEVPESA